MNYIPDRYTKKPIIISVVLAVLGVVLMMLASVFPPPAVMQLTGIGVCALGVFVLYRYVLCYYVYSIDEDDFAVTRVTGKRNLTLCRIPYSQILSVCSISSPSELYDQKLSGKYSYTVNFDPGKKRYYIYIEDGDRVSRITLEGSTDMARAIAGRLAPDAEVKIK